MSTPYHRPATGQSTRPVATVPPVEPNDLTLRVEFKDNWLVSFLDILLLFITMLSVLIVLKTDDRQAADGPAAAMDVIEAAVSQIDVSVYKPGLAEANAIAAKAETEAIDSLSANPFATVISMPLPVADTNTRRTQDTVADTVPPLRQPEQVAQPASKKTLADTHTGAAAPGTATGSQTATQTGTEAVTEAGHDAIETGRAIALASQFQSDAMPIAKNAVTDSGALNFASLQLLPEMDLSQKDEGLVITLKDKVLFASGRATLSDAGKAVIRKLQQVISPFDGQLSVEGHTDNQPISTPQFPSNWELSSARASTVARELIALGIPAGRIRAIGYADTLPVDSNRSASGRDNNRRVAILLHIDESRRQPLVTF